MAFQARNSCHERRPLGSWSNSGVATVKSNPTPNTPNPSLYDQAICAGKGELERGGTKADAAIAIYRILGNEDRDTVLQALIEGATVTPKASGTYLYNVKRKLRIRS